MCGRIGFVMIVMSFLAACGTSPPVVTPTVAPTDTPDLTRIAQQATVTPIIQPTATDTPTRPPTNTPRPSRTPTQTVTPSQTPTGTQTPSSTPSRTPTQTPSNTPTITLSPTLTDAPSPTPLVIKTASPTASPSQTPSLTAPPTKTPSPTATATPTATLTRTPNIAATRNAELLQTRAASSPTAIQMTFTPVPQASPTHTVAATLDVTPTFVTALPNTGIIPTPDIAVTAIQSTPILEVAAPTVTATPLVAITPSPFPIEQIPATVQAQSQEAITRYIAPAFNNTTTSALTFNVGTGGEFIFNGEALGGGSVRLFAVNPADPTSFARTSETGYLTFAPIGSSEGTLTTSPFVPGFAPASAEVNQDYVSYIVWSPNGQRLAFIIQPAGGTDNQDAGVWFWDASGAGFALLHDCPYGGYTSCELSSHPVNNWQSQQVEWSPNSAQVIITATLTTEGRQGIFIADMNFSSRRPQAPPFLRWDNGQWLDNNRILVSGRAPDGRSMIAVYDLGAATITEVLFDASANGLFIADAVQRGNGQLVAIGREGGAGDGAYRLYRIENGGAIPISDFIGGAPPQQIAWAANQGEAVLTVNGQQYIVNASSGGIARVNAAGSVQVGNLATNPGGDVRVQAPPPDGVVADSAYDAGQQIQYVGEIARNMRVQPSLSAAIADVLNPGEFVTVLAGPYQADGYIWWQVSNPRNTRAWISASVVGGGSFFVP